MLLVDVAPDFEHIGDDGEIAVEVRLRTWVRGGRVRHDLGLEFAGQGAEQRLEVVPPPRKTGIERVLVVTCKSWQVGFDADAKLGELRGTRKNPKRATWHHFRDGL